MLQPAGHLDLQHEPLANLWVVGEPFLKLLHRHLAVQLAIECNAHTPDPAIGVVLQHAKPPMLRARHRARPRCVDGHADIIERGRLDLHMDFRRQRVRRAGESSIDHLNQVGEPAAILFQVGRRTFPHSQFSFDLEQLIEQPSTGRDVNSVQIFLDPRRLSGKPRTLKSVGHQVDQARVVIGCATHAGSPAKVTVTDRALARSRRGTRTADLTRSPRHTPPIWSGCAQLALDRPLRAIVKLASDLFVRVTFQLAQRDPPQHRITQGTQAPFQFIVKRRRIGRRRFRHIRWLEVPRSPGRISAARFPLASKVTRFTAVLSGHVPCLANRHGHQQLPEVVAAAQIEVATLLPDAKAGVHALEHVIFILPAQQPAIEMMSSQAKQRGHIAVPQAPGSVFTQARIDGTQLLDQTRDGSLRVHRRFLRPSTGH